MTLHAGPPIDTRRTAEFLAELRQRARAWLPAWQLDEDEQDFGRALLEIAARFNSEVAERLNRGAEKMQRGFFDWLAVRGAAARPARVPVVFTLADTATAGVPAPKPVALQAASGDTPVAFETETDIQIVPGRIDGVVAVDADNDAYYLPPPGLSDLQPLDPVPVQWQSKSFTSVGATTVQLDPEGGLEPGTILEAAGRQYRVVLADRDLVTIEPPLEVELPIRAPVTKVTAFVPFGATARNWQEHALYFGDPELLNIEAPATIEVIGSARLRSGVTWQYWGKRESSDDPDWRPLPIDDARQDAIVLQKPKGSIEPREIAGAGGRWIRAYAKTIGADEAPITADAFALRINAAECEDTGECPPTTDSASTASAAMANTTPLVLDKPFFPLGKEPRQFDAFYLGSAEAFSKPGAKVHLCFEMADPTFTTLSLLRRGALANQVLAGVAKDRALHLLSFSPATGVIGKFRQHDPLQPPLPAFPGQTTTGGAISLDAPGAWRLPVWFDGPTFAVATCAGNAVWVWREDQSDPNNAGWFGLGVLPPDTQASPRSITGLVHLQDAQSKVFALRGGSLFARDWDTGTQWVPVPTREGFAGATIELNSIVPVLVDDGTGQMITSAAAGMVGVGAAVGAAVASRRLFHVSAAGICTALDGATNFSVEHPPVAYRDAGGTRYVAAVNTATPAQLVAIKSTGGGAQKAEPSAKPLGALDFAAVGGRFHVLASVSTPGSGRLATWAPFEAGSAGSLFETPVSAGGSQIGGAPTALPQHVLIPGQSADLLTATLDLNGRVSKAADIGIGVVVAETMPALETNDLVVLNVGNAPESRTITASGVTKTGETFYPIDADFTAGAASPLLAFDMSETLPGTFTGPDQLALAAGDLQTEAGPTSWLWVDSDFYTVDAVNVVGTSRVATISSPTGGAMPSVGTYVRPIVTGGQVVPFMRLDPSANGAWDAALLDRFPLIFQTTPVEEHKGKAFTVAIGNKPQLVVIRDPFTHAVVNPLAFVIDATVGAWQAQLGDTSTNPELSWEYWNGNGWWALDTRDTTLQLKKTGSVRFVVPSDLVPSDWAGQTNLWIRARLIGGDYGRETVKVKTKDLGNKETEQTVERSIDGIHPPVVIKLHVSYGICDDVRPRFLLTRDSGSYRDQSDANRTAGAIVEAFVPLSLMLGRLLNPEATDAAPPACPPECVCHSTPAASTPPSATADSATPAGTGRVGGRSIFVGLTREPSGEPVHVLVLADVERDHRAFAPLRVRAHVADRFVPVVADDRTRALGESGLLTMAFTVPPTARELFGEARAWLHLTPGGTGHAEWRPALRGAYLNGIWAAATETLTRELLGSSDGRPHLTVTVARPPLLEKTLELRVREPLGEEERTQLRASDPDCVLNPVEGLPGDWVRWEQVDDPGDEAPQARVYALDESAGVIRFGDGRHGRIPPIGVDSIVAFKYQRTEPGPPGTATVPGNAIVPRTALNLITAVESVESVIAADQAAGGAPPESTDRVLRFGVARLRHRSRVISAHDIEDLALQSSPDIAQARAFPRRGYLRLVVVIRGRVPGPTAAQTRELLRLLRDAAPASLSAPGALRITGPDIRRLRLELALRVASLDDVGTVSRVVRERLWRLFDTAEGGTAGEGWPLGANPSDQEVAYALLDTPRLASVDGVSLFEVGGDRRQRAWPAAIKSTELAMLADDPLRLRFESGEAAA